MLRVCTGNCLSLIKVIPGRTYFVFFKYFIKSLSKKKENQFKTPPKVMKISPQPVQFYLSISEKKNDMYTYECLCLLFFNKVGARFISQSEHLLSSID